VGCSDAPQEALQGSLGRFESGPLHVIKFPEVLSYFSERGRNREARVDEFPVPLQLHFPPGIVFSREPAVG